MKCPYCGGNLSIENAFCPNCGKRNDAVLQHDADMKRYRNEFEKTKDDVVTSTRRFTKTSVQIVIIAVLIVITVGCTFFAANAYGLVYEMKTKDANSKYSEYSKIIDEYLDNQEYIAVSEFVEAKNIRTYDSPYEKYTPVIRLSGYYSNIYQYILRMDTYEDDEYLERNASSLIDTLDYFYKALNIDKYEYNDGANCQENIDNMKKQEEAVNALLVTYCGVSKEDVAEFKNLSSAKRAIIVEEGLLGEKE